MVEIFLIHLGGIIVRWRRIGFWPIPENRTDILPYKKRTAGNDRTLVPYPQGKAVDMVMAGIADNQDTGRGIPDHLPVQAAGNPVDLKEWQCKVFRAEFAAPFNSDLDLFFLYRGQYGIFGHRHNASRPGDPSIPDTFPFKQ